MRREDAHKKGSLQTILCARMLGPHEAMADILQMIKDLGVRFGNLSKIVLWSSLLRSRFLNQQRRIPSIHGRNFPITLPRSRYRRVPYPVAVTAT